MIQSSEKIITNIEKLKKAREIVNRIDWSMTPEKAIDMYLEWGAGWTRGNDFIRGAEDESIYFVIYDWEQPRVTLLKRNSREVEELAKVAAPPELVKNAIAEGGKKAGVGVYPLTHELKVWLSDQLDGPQVE